MTSARIAGAKLEVAPTFYDMRHVLALVKKLQGIDGPVQTSDLPRINPFRIRRARRGAVAAINHIEEMPSLYPGRSNPLSSTATGDNGRAGVGAPAPGR